MISAALTGHCVRQIWQVALLRDFYGPPLTFTGRARRRRRDGVACSRSSSPPVSRPPVRGRSNPAARVLADVLPPTRWLARRRWWLLLPFAALAATMVITQWVLPAPLATDMGYAFPTFPGATGIVCSVPSVRRPGRRCRSCSRCRSCLACGKASRRPGPASGCQQARGGQTALLSRVRRIDYRLAAAAVMVGVTGFAVAKGSALSALAGAGLLLSTALSLSGSLGRAARLLKGFERRVRGWQLPEDWRDLGRVSLLLVVSCLPRPHRAVRCVPFGVRNGLWFPLDLSRFDLYWQYYDLIGIPSITASGIFGHVDTVIWEACLGLAAVLLAGMPIQGFDKDVRDGFKGIWFLIRVGLFAIALAPVLKMADHSYATFVLAGCAVLAIMITARGDARPDAVWSVIIVGGALALWSLLIWRTSGLPAAAMLSLTILQRFVYNAGDLNDRGEHRPNRVAYFQAISLLSVAMLALGHGAATGYFESDDFSTVSDRVSLSVVAAIWLVMLVARQRRPRRR